MKNKPLPIEFLDHMAGVLKVMGHGYRLGIIEFLDLNGQMPAHRLQAALGGAQSAISQHLTKLRQAGVIRAERRGKEVWYALTSPSALTILNCMRKRRK